MESKKKNIVIALMVAMFLAAVEGTIVTIAVPTIVNDLKGFENISLIFSVYLLASAVSTPIYGKLADLYGRKNVLSIGIIIFLTGSLLCGLSRTMNMLIVFRAVQGLGAGSIFTITYTIVGDIFTLDQKPKIQGSIGSVWGIASLAGPFLGGFIIDVLSWHWLFFINLPFGILSVVLLQRNLKEHFKKKKHHIDYAGIIVFSAAIIILLNTFLTNENAGTSPIFVGFSLLSALILLFIFYIIEKKSKEPIIPLDIFTKTTILINALSFLNSMTMIGNSVYLPVYLQNILGYNPTLSGLIIAPMTVSWLISSFLLGKCITKLGGKTILIFSNMTMFISLVLLSFLNTQSSLPYIIMCNIIFGAGLGGAFATLTIAVQSSAAYNKRGAAMAANALLRTLGQTIGISIMGGVFNFYIIQFFNNIGINGINPSNIYTSSNTAVTLEQIKLSLNNSLHHLYIILATISAISIFLALILPKISCEDTDIPQSLE